jgi:MoaA/NifB/PqqE/SkfB family radical SAM enzyme|tara:strand:- start:600 stop:1478 length:879 start_codon:yes stop_codon:yes gene_type:complete
MKNLHVEASTYCNARCPLCPRSLHGYKVEGVYPEVHLSVDKFKEALERFPAREHVYFNGHLGDPMMNPKIVELAEQTRCRTSVTSNGGIGTKDTWEALAELGVEARFSIDGLEDTNHLYRQDVKWDKIMERAKWFIGAGGYASWKWIPFSHNSHQEDETRKFALGMGFQGFTVEDHGRSHGPALDREGNITHWILPRDGSLKPGNYDVPAGIKRYKQTHQNFQVEDKVYDVQCEHLRFEDTYINAKGQVGPCCYHGYDMPGRPFVKLEDHHKLMATWKTKKCNPVCANTCGN